MDNESLRGLIVRWTAELEMFRRYKAAVDGALLVERFLCDLAGLEELREAEVLTITQAASRSGYSCDHLRRLVREGKLFNVGRTHSPRVRAVDLPRRIQKPLSGKAEHAYDPITDARSLGVRR